MDSRSRKDSNVLSRQLFFTTLLDVNISSGLFQGAFSSGGGHKDLIDYELEVITPRDRRHAHLWSILNMLNTDDERSAYIAQCPILVNLTTDYIKEEDPNRIAERLGFFINHYFSAIEHIYLDFTIPRYRLDGRRILFRKHKNQPWRRLEYLHEALDLDDIFEEYALLNESGKSDVLDGFASDPKSIEPSWGIFVDGIRHFYEGRFRETVINCCSAAEVEITPRVQSWLTNQSYTGSKDLVRNASIEIGNPMRFELFFKSVMPDALTIYSKPQQVDLLEKLKSLNAKRNDVVHQGREATKADAKLAIRATGLLLRSIWITYGKGLEIHKIGLSNV